MKKKIIGLFSIFFIILGIENVVFADVIYTPPSVELALYGLLYFPIPAGLLLFIDLLGFLATDLGKNEKKLKILSIINIVFGMLTGLSAAIIYNDMNFTACFFVGLASVLFSMVATVCYIKKSYRLAMILAVIGLALGFGDLLRFYML